MRLTSLAACALAATFSGLFVAPLAAQTAEQLTFIPAGGRTLLSNIAASKPSADELKALLTGKHSLAEWTAYLKSRGQALPAVQRLNDKEQATLADYLSYHMPLPQMPANLARTDWTRTLPKDGRDLSLDNCQGCHIITVVVTQDRSKTNWLGTMSTPAHAAIKMTPAERDEIATYLVLNAGIPIEKVPEELRASGATY